MKYFLIIIIVVINSCNSFTSRNDLKEFYPTGELMISTTTTNDNRLDGELKYFDKSGEVISTQSWLNGHFKNVLDSYDTNLIDFFTKHLIVEIDPILIKNSNHELEIINFPEHILSLSTENGKVIFENGKWILTPDNSSKSLKLLIYARFDGQIKEILAINKIIEEK